jgi:peptidoglycan-N-acetylglucosamine deacetylase
MNLAEELMMGTILSGVATAAIGVTAYGVFNTKANLLAPSIWRGPTDRPAIALTFDDGPSESTEAILTILQRQRISATFFQCGENVRRLPQVAQEVRAAGHTLGNHTQTHPRLCFKSSSFIYSELARAQETIEQATNMRPRLFRAPFGLRWYGLGRAQRRLGLTGVMWTAIGYDWSEPAARVIQFVLEQVTSGAIVCLHDGRRTRTRPDISSTVSALAALVPMLIDRGFYFESLDSMMLRLVASADRPAENHVSA